MVRTRRSSFSIPSLPVDPPVGVHTVSRVLRKTPQREERKVAVGDAVDKLPPRGPKVPRPPRLNKSASMKSRRDSVLHGINVEGCHDLLALPDPPTPPSRRRRFSAPLPKPLQDVTNSSNMYPITKTPKSQRNNWQIVQVNPANTSNQCVRGQPTPKSSGFDPPDASLLKSSKRRKSVSYAASDVLSEKLVQNPKTHSPRSNGEVREGDKDGTPRNGDNVLGVFLEDDTMDFLQLSDQEDSVKTKTRKKRQSTFFAKPPLRATNDTSVSMQRDNDTVSTGQRRRRRQSMRISQHDVGELAVEVLSAGGRVKKTGDEQKLEEPSGALLVASPESAKKRTRKQRQSILLPVKALQRGVDSESEAAVENKSAQDTAQLAKDMASLRALVRQLCSKEPHPGRAQICSRIKVISSYPMDQTYISKPADDKPEVGPDLSGRDLFAELGPSIMLVDKKRREEKKEIEEWTGCRVEKAKGAKFVYTDLSTGNRVQASEYEVRYMEAMKVSRAERVQHFGRIGSTLQPVTTDGGSENATSSISECDRNRTDDLQESPSPTMFPQHDDGKAQVGAQCPSLRSYPDDSTQANPKAAVDLLPLPSRDKLSNDPKIAAAERRLWGAIDRAREAYSREVLAIRSIQTNVSGIDTESSAMPVHDSRLD